MLRCKTPTILNYNNFNGFNSLTVFIAFFIYFSSAEASHPAAQAKHSSALAKDFRLFPTHFATATRFSCKHVAMPSLCFAKHFPTLISFLRIQGPGPIKHSLVQISAVGSFQQSRHSFRGSWQSSASAVQSSAPSRQSARPSLQSIDTIALISVAPSSAQPVQTSSGQIGPL